MGACKGTNITAVLGDPETAGNPVDPSIVITAKDIAWSANPVCTLRPLASDLNVTRRARVVTTR